VLVDRHSLRLVFVGESRWGREKVAHRARNRGWANRATGGTNTDLSFVWTKRGSTRIAGLARDEGGASEKEGGCGLRPFEDHESPGRSARTSVLSCRSRVGDVWSRISPRAAPSKRERGGSERGPRAARVSAVTRRRPRPPKRCRHVDPSPRLKVAADDRRRPRVA
jgi:hypothetical protein